MIRRHLLMLKLALMVADGVSATIVFVTVSLVRFGDGDVTQLWRLIGIDLRIAALLFGVGWVGALWYLGLYRMHARWRLLTEAQDIVKATLVVAIVTFSTLFLFNQDQVSRLFLALLFITQALVTLAGRTYLRYAFGAIRQRGRNIRFMLVAGTGTLACDFADRVEGTGQPRHPRHRALVGAGRGPGRDLATDPRHAWTSSSPCCTRASSTRSRSVCRLRRLATSSRLPVSPKTKARR